MSRVNAYTIKDLENLSGIKAHTIRIWEQRYSFLKPNRTNTNIRFYSNEDLKKLLNISLLNRYGFKISHIDKMCDGEMCEKILSLHQVEAQQERIVNELIQNMVDMDMDRFEQVLGNYILARGIERSILQIIFPFLERIGVLWQTNHINAAQEHLVSNIVRQKLIVGIEGANPVLKSDKSVLLFMPEGEYHELGLLFMCYMLKSKGIKTIYIGGNVPLKDLDCVVSLKQPDYLYCHITAPGKNFNLDKFLQNITLKFGSKHAIVISGQLTHSYQKKLPKAVSVKRSLAEAIEFIYSL